MTDPRNALTQEDRQQMVDATIRYCWAIDGGNWAELADVFDVDAVVEFGFMPAVQGLPAIEAVVKRALGSLDGSQHIVANHQIEASDDGIRSRCYFQAQHIRKGVEGGANYIIAGIYRDRWSAEGDAWRIVHRELEVLWTDGNPAVVGRLPRDPTES